MPSAEEFDEFYVATRRRLVLQTFALTGDLAAAQSAVRDAFVAARHHWGKVARLEDPEDWVRPRAWSIAQRRHASRVWHKEKTVQPEVARVLEALHDLPDVERRVLILNHLSSLSLAQIGREIGQTEERTAEYLQRGTASLSTALDCSGSGIRLMLEALEPMSSAVSLPRAPMIRRSGAARRRWHLITGSVMAVLLTIAAGAFVAYDDGGSSLPQVSAPPAHPVTKAMLLTADQITPISPKQTWLDTGTSDNTEGTGINSVCQATRFADPKGTGTFVRKFTASGTPDRSLVQTVEISSSIAAAKAAYKTTLGWFAGCTQARLQLLNAYMLSGLGDQAQLLRLRIPDKTLRTYVVGIVRTGSLTTSTVIETSGGHPGKLTPIINALSESVLNLCPSTPAGTCRLSARIVPVLPPPSGETRGMLAVADLPAIGKINKPWVGTDPISASANVAATTCDKANYITSGAPKPLERTFLIPQANLPQRFGLVETYGGFSNTAAANAFSGAIVKRMATCAKRDLSSTVTHTVVVKKGFHGSSYALWRLTNEINSKAKVEFWMGIAQVGMYVAQVNFTPVPGNDIDEETFQALLSRARDRLFELPAS
jgi:DNA-directed RNA polymerase specialized sigma24 family protein